MTQPDETTGDLVGSAAPLDERDLRHLILTRLADLAGPALTEVDPTSTFSELGVDSVVAVELMADLETELGRELDPTLVFSAETPAQLASVLASGAIGPRRRRPSTRATDAAPAADRHDEPIAVVGIGCRFPGAHGPDRYWQMLLDGVDAVSEMTGDRWERDPTLPASVDRGGFVDGIDQFDPGFFGITQLEADRMDPQQRMLLEVAWEALEDAGVRPSSLRGTDVGVFVGISTNEYSRRQSASPELVDVFFGTGNALSIAANRISYVLDLNGPSIAIDTACSSSLVAVHLACASLRRGECSSALAGGANAILTPLLTLNFIGAGVIAPDGRCKTFDASADGIVRGEGAGLIHLKRLSDAEADGDRIYCVIEGSATNQDGHSNGLTAPDPGAQIDVFSAACAAAGIDPAEVDYVEAHGTGTVLGDAMELRSLDAVYGPDRSEDAPLLVGSVKTNIGHLESAAGIAGLIKAALAVRNATIPPTLHYREPNPYLGQTARIRVADEVLQWTSGRTRRAAVSGFGFGGTNAHAILRSAPDHSTSDGARTSDGAVDDDIPIILPLSARSAAALDASVALHATRLADDPGAARDLAAAQALTRDEHPRRLAVVAADGQSVAHVLDELVAGKRHGSAITGERRSSEPARTAFLFSGQGRAWWPFDGELLADPVISAVLRTCDSELREIADFSLLDLIRSGAAVMDHERAQPLLFSLQVALAARWRSYGVEPDLIVGQSIGEIAAAHVAGALPLADALEVVLHRGRLMEESNGTGHTAFVELPAGEVSAMIEELGLDVTVAAVTAPDNCVVSGPKADTVSIVAAAAERGVMAQVFDVGDIPGHGPLMAPYADKLTDAVGFLDPRPTSVPFISSVTAGPVEGEELGAEYWGRNLRQQVRLMEAIGTAVDRDTELFIEIAPHPVVSFSTRRTLESLGSSARVLHTVKQGEPGALAFRRSLASAWVDGAAVDWRAVTGRSRAPIPALRSPWDHRRCWFDLTGATREQERPRASSGWHPTLDDGTDLGDGSITWRVLGAPTAPGAPDRAGVGTVLELALAAARAWSGSHQVALSDIHLASELESLLEKAAETDLSVSVSPRPGRSRWSVVVVGGRDRSATVLAEGDLRPLDEAPPELLGADRTGIDAPVTATTGLPRQVRTSKVDERTAVLTVEIPPARDDRPRWVAGPLLLDAMSAGIRVLGPPQVPFGDPNELRHIDEIRLLGDPSASARVVLDRTSGDATVVDEWAAPVVELRGPTLGRALPSAPEGDLVLPVWSSMPPPDADAVAPDRAWTSIASAGDAQAMAVTRGLAATIVDPPGLDAAGLAPSLTEDGSGLLVFDPDPSDLQSLLGSPTLTGRTVVVVTYLGPTSATVPALLRENPEIDLRWVDVDDGEGSTELLIYLLARHDIPQVVSIRSGRAASGQLRATPVPDVVRRSEPAGQRPHAAMWDADGTIRLAVAPEPGERPLASGAARVRVERALIGGPVSERAVPGEVAGVGAVGKVVDGPAELRDRTVAIVASGAAASYIDADVSAVWPVPDVTTGMQALLALVALHPDLRDATALEPVAVRATFTALLDAHEGRPAEETALASVAGRRPTSPTAVTFGDPTTPVEEIVARWSATGTWAVLAAEDDPFGDAVVDWLRERGAELVALDDADAAPATPTGVIVVGAAPVQLLDDIDSAVVWIGPSSVLLGVETPEADEARAAVTVAGRPDRGHPATTFLVGSSVDAEDALAVLDRVLLSGTRIAAYDPLARGIVGEADPRPDGWFAPLATRSRADTDAPDDASVASALADAASTEHLEIVATHIASEIAAIVGIDPTDIDHSEPVDTYGVDSLVGMEMRSRIQSTFAYEVPLSELSRTMTVDELTTHLIEHAVPALLSSGADRRATGSEPDALGRGGTEVGQPDAGSTAVAVQRGNGPVTWWIPGIFGSAEVFGPLGQGLADHDMWALEQHGLPSTSVIDAADAHLHTIRSRQPSGPYRVGGYSYGGLVAVEIALALEAAGEDVERLWLLDPPPPSANDDAATRAERRRRVRELLAGHLNELFGAPGLTADDLPPLEPGAELDPLVERIVTGGTPWSSDRVLDHLQALWTVTTTSLEAMAAHRPSGVVAAPTNIVVASRSGLFGPGADAAWKQVVAGSIERSTFDTDHAGLLAAPHAGAVAEVVRRSLSGPGRTAMPHPEEQPMSTDAAPTTLSRRARRAILSGLTHSPRSRAAVGAIGNAYRQADFFLRALGAERRFRRVCVPGDDFIVGEHAQISNLTGDPERIRFGNNCLVDGFINVQEYGYFTMGSYSGIGEKVRIDCAGYVEIGNGCTMAEGVYIIDGLHHPILADERIKHGIDLFRGDHVMDAYGTGTETSFVRIEDLVWIGLRAIVLSGVTIGRGSVVAAGAVVSQDVPPFSVVAGNPARVVGRIPDDDFDIETHPTYLAVHGDERLPDHRRPVREVLEEIAARVAGRNT